MRLSSSEQTSGSTVLTEARISRRHAASQSWVSPGAWKLKRWCGNTSTDRQELLWNAHLQAEVTVLEMRIRALDTAGSRPGVEAPVAACAQGEALERKRASSWLSWSSLALKKWGDTWGPMRKVMFLCMTGTVNTSPHLAYPSFISFRGP